MIDNEEAERILTHSDDKPGGSKDTSAAEVLTHLEASPHWF